MSRTRVDHGERIAELHQALTAQLSEMTTSEDWMKYLSTARLFHRYSPQNQMLLAVQGAEGAVAGYRNWQRIPAEGGGTCQVAKGEEGLLILAPLKGRSVQPDEITGEDVTKHFLRGFRTVKVFHQGQLIAPPDLGHETIMPKLLTGDSRWQHVWSAVTDQLGNDGFEVSFHSRSPVETWNGATDYSTRRVLIADDLDPAQQLKTLLHEWGHVRLDHETRIDVPRNVREVEAESVAYLLANTIGLDSQAYSIPYLAGWSEGDLALVESTAQMVLSTTKELVETLERDLGVSLTVDILDHALPDAETNVIAVPGATPPDPIHEATIAQVEVAQDSLFPLADVAVSALDRSDSTDAEFLMALGQELDPDQSVELVTYIYRPDHAAESAEILASSGRSALQTARILDRFGVGHDQIREALVSPAPPTDDGVATLYPVEEVDHAMLIVAPATAPAGVAVPPDVLRGEKVQDMRMLQRVLRTSHNAVLACEIAQTFELEPHDVIRVCEVSSIDPSLTLAVAVGMYGGDGRAALDALKSTWPNIEGGWESYAHPSMLGPAPAPLSLVPTTADHDPMREIFAQWDAMKTAKPSSPSTPDPFPFLP